MAFEHLGSGQLPTSGLPSRPVHARLDKTRRIWRLSAERGGAPLGASITMIMTLLISCLLTIHCASFSIADSSLNQGQIAPRWALTQPAKVQFLDTDGHDWHYVENPLRVSSLLRDDETFVYGSELRPQYQLAEQNQPDQQQVDASQLLQQVVLAKMLLGELRNSESAMGPETSRWQRQPVVDIVEDPVYRLLPDQLNRLTNTLRLVDQAQDLPQEQQSRREDSFAALGSFGQPVFEEDVAEGSKTGARETRSSDSKEPKLTTLLEDEHEQQENFTTITDSSPKAQTTDNNKTTTYKITKNESASSTISPNFGTLVTGTSEHKSSGWSFGNIYQKLVNYVPFFSGWLTNNTATSNGPVVPMRKFKQTSNDDNRIDRTTKQDDVYHMEHHQSEVSRSEASGTSHSMDGTPSKADKRNDASTSADDDTVSGQSVDLSSSPVTSNLRKSSMLVSMDEQKDDPRVKGSSFAPSTSRRSPPADEGLVGSYNIYAPTHHFHLNTPALGVADLDAAASGDSISDSDELGRGVLNYVRSMRPAAGAPTAAAFSGLGGYRQAGLDQHHEQGLMKQVSNNDAYFLVMVSAFCVMAMAVVLAAGLFAYRIQQSRKSNSEPEYPTYGVVGPNSMSAKQAGLGGYGFGPAPPRATNLHHHLTAAAGHHHGHLGGSGRTKLAGSGHQLSVGHPGKGLHHGGTMGDLYSAASDSGVITGGSNASGKQSSISSKRSVSNELPGGFMGNQNAARMYHYQQQKQQMIAADRVSSGRHTSASDIDSDDDDNEEGSYTVYECPGLASAHEMEIKNPLFNDDHSP